jgi:pyridoxal phosphate enzyme (YggS family)
MSETFSDRLARVQERVQSACARSGRPPAAVALIAVSKTHGPEAVAEAVACGLRRFGENKVQEAGAKIPLCPGGLTWDLVGHLQSNKAYAAVALFDLIHSVDSIKLARVLDRAGDELGKRVRILLEVNVSGESSKFGLKPDEVPAVLEAANELPRLEVLGLMTMAPLAPEAEKARPHFRRLRELRDQWACQLGTPLPELSMGMSHDFDVAIEEGATCIRVGTLLFGERSRSEVT